MIRVSIAASSPIVRAGLEAVVRSIGGLDVAGILTIAEVADQLDGMRADVLLIELPGFDEDWISTFAGSSVPVVLLTETAEPGLLAAAFRANVRAVLSTDALAGEIDAAIRSAAAGLITMQQQLMELFTPIARPISGSGEEPLSPREVQVLGMLAEGLSNKLIAHRLSISEHTVKFHVTSIMAKLQAASRTDAVMQGIRRGLVMI